MNKLRSIAAAAALLAFVAPASAQMAPYGMPNAANGYDLSGMGMPDFTNTDITGFSNAWTARRNVDMQQVTAQVIYDVLSNPYAVRVLQSGACGGGSPEQLAYIYAATAGCTREGISEYGRVTGGIMDA